MNENSKSVQRRIAAQKGLPPPDFSREQEIERMVAVLERTSPPCSRVGRREAAAALYDAGYRLPSEPPKEVRERIAKEIYDWGYANEYFRGSNKVWNFVDDAEPEKDGARDLAIKILGLLKPPELTLLSEEEIQNIRLTHHEYVELRTKADKYKSNSGLYFDNEADKIIKQKIAQAQLDHNRKEVEGK